MPLIIAQSSPPPPANTAISSQRARRRLVFSAPDLYKSARFFTAQGHPIRLLVPYCLEPSHTIAVIY